MKLRHFLFAALIVSCSTIAQSDLSYPLVSTGQVLCYDLNGELIAAPAPGDDLYGQDGNYQAGLAMSFVDNGDGTITDLNTGLIWEKTPGAGPVTWSEAGEYCDALELGGHSDWRLPTLKELFSISNFSTGWPYIDTTYFDLSSKGRVDKDEQFWASNKYVGVTVEGRGNAAFGVNHATGHIKAYAAGGQGGQRGQRPEGEQAGQGGQRGQRPEGEQAGQGGQRGQRPEGEQAGQGGQRGQRPEGEQTGEGRQRGQRPEGEQTGEGRQRGQRPEGEQAGQGGQRGQRPEGEQAGQGGQRGQRPEGEQAGQGGGAPMMMGNPMQKRVRAVRGSIYGENKFVDNGDGTISDKATGLIWAKADNGSGVEWATALQYAESSELAGYSDWRLPNVKELQSIVDYSYSSSSSDVKPAIDPLFSCTPFVNEAGSDDFGYYWTGTSALFRLGSPYYFAWYVAFGMAVNNEGKDFHGAGAVRFDSKSNNGMAVEGGEERYYNFVRLVREEK